MKKLGTIGSLTLAIVCALAPWSAEAQRYKYMDSSGNIHFVDSWKQVPREFREQIIPPTPTPALDDKTRRQLQRQKEREVRDAQRKVEARKREIEKNMKAAQKHSQTNSARGEAPSADQGRSREGHIEMIR